MVDTITWVKLNKDMKLQHNCGYYLRHAKEVCLVGLKGAHAGRGTLQRQLDVILSPNQMHSRKPDHIYEIAEALWP